MHGLRTLQLAMYTDWCVSLTAGLGLQPNTCMVDHGMIVGQDKKIK